MALMPLRLILMLQQLVLLLRDHAHIVGLLAIKAVRRGHLLGLGLRLLPNQLVRRLMLYLRLLLKLKLMLMMLLQLVLVLLMAMVMVVWTGGCRPALEPQVPRGDQYGAPVRLLDAMVLLEVIVGGLLLVRLVVA